MTVKCQQAEILINVQVDILLEPTNSSALKNVFFFMFWDNHKMYAYKIPDLTVWYIETACLPLYTAVEENTTGHM